MLTILQSRLLTLLGSLALALVLVNGTLFVMNRDAQSDVNSRQQFLQQTVQLERLYRDIVKALAELAVKGGDNQILQMLTAQGINVSVNAPATNTAAPAPSRQPVRP